MGGGDVRKGDESCLQRGMYCTIFSVAWVLSPIADFVYVHIFFKKGASSSPINCKHSKCNGNRLNQQTFSQHFFLRR